MSSQIELNLAKVCSMDQGGDNYDDIGRKGIYCSHIVLESLEIFVHNWAFGHNHNQK